MITKIANNIKFGKTDNKGKINDEVVGSFMWSYLKNVTRVLLSMDTVQWPTALSTVENDTRQ